MEDPLLYREHTERDHEVQVRRRAQRTLLSGLTIFAVSAIGVSGPLLWGRWGLNKYIVTVALLGAMCGLSAMIHGAWDWWQGGR